MFAPNDWRIKSHISYIHFYREWLCNNRCISTGLIETRVTVEETAHFSLLSGKKLSELAVRPFHRGIGRRYLWSWTEQCSHAPLPPPPLPPWKAQQCLHLRPSYTTCLRGFSGWPRVSGVYVFGRLAEIFTRFQSRKLRWPWKKKIGAWKC